MLAAGNGKDDLCAPAHRLFQSEIRCRIAGVESHHHIHLVHALVGGDVPGIEGQLFVAVFYGQAIAFFYHVFFQIQPDDPHRVSFQFLQIIIHGKGQIGLSAAEIQDHRLPGTVQPRQDILNEFQEPVDLAEFVIPGIYDLAILCHNAQIHQERDGFPFLQNVILFPVMGQSAFPGIV